MSEKKLLRRGSPSQIEDGRGRIVSQLDPLVMKLLRRHDRIPAEALREIVKEAAPGWAKWGRFVIGGFVLLAVAARIAGTIYAVYPSPPRIGRRSALSVAAPGDLMTTKSPDVWPRLR